MTDSEPGDAQPRRVAVPRPVGEAAPQLGPTSEDLMAPAILVVDDHADVRQVVRAVLEADGYQVAEAADGPAALMLIDSIGGPRGPHLVVLDIMMPGIDGLEVCRRVPHDRMKVLMLTALDDGETRDAAALAGADGYLTKPFSAVEFLDTVRDLLAAASR